MKTQIFLFAALVTLLALPSYASKNTIWSCSVAQIADGGDFESMNDFSFNEHPLVGISVENDGSYSAHVGTLQFGGDTLTAVSEIQSEGNFQVFAAYSDFNEDEFKPILFIEIFNPQAQKTIGTVRYHDLDSGNIRLLGSFHCQK